MIALLQRVAWASVDVDGQRVAEIGAGLLVLLGIDRGDTPATGERMLDRLLNYRVFADASGRMNLSLKQTGGGLLLVPQFTLAADTRKGTRASLSRAADPDAGRALFDSLVELAQIRHREVAAGVFGATMQVALSNDGPVTFILHA